jgi:hypothetical protein
MPVAPVLAAPFGSSRLVSPTLRVASARARQPLFHFTWTKAAIKSSAVNIGPSLLGQPICQGLHPFGGDYVWVLLRINPPGVYGGDPALTGEAQLSDPLVGPFSDNGLSCGVTRAVVVEATLGAALRVAAGPHAHVHRAHGRFAFADKRMTDEKLPQSFGVDPSPAQRRVEASTAATMR